MQTKSIRRAIDVDRLDMAAIFVGEFIVIIVVITLLGWRLMLFFAHTAERH